MKKIILISLIFIGVVNVGFAVNDFNKLSEKDKQQCEKMEYIASYTTFKKLNKEGYWDDEYTKEQMEEFYQEHVRRLRKYDIEIKNIDDSIGKNKNQENVFNYAINELSIESTNNIGMFNTYMINLVSKVNNNKEIKYLGITRITISDHAHELLPYHEYYNIGYLLDVSDYIKINQIKDVYVPFHNFPKLKFLVLVKERPPKNSSYIKINNCFVEEYIKK